jgi:hypothetical protein
MPPTWLSRSLRYFTFPVAVVMVTVVVVAGVGVVYGIARVTARLELEAVKRDLCAERLRSLERRSAFVERFVRPAEPCEALKIVETQP